MKARRDQRVQMRRSADNDPRNIVSSVGGDELIVESLMIFRGWVRSVRGQHVHSLSEHRILSER